MFNKLVSNLPFNPSLLNQVGFYVKRLKQEQFVRRVGFVFITLAMFIQIFAVVAPPKESLAASDSNIIPGGTYSRSSLLQKYNANSWVRFVYNNYFGINSDDIGKMQVGRIQIHSSSSYTMTDSSGHTVATSSSLRTAGRRANGSSGEEHFTAAGIPLYRHTLNSAFRANSIAVLYCPASACGSYKAVAVDCGNPIKGPTTITIPTADASCTLLTLSSDTVVAGEVLTVNVTAATVNGATISSFNYNFGDGTLISRPSTASTDTTTHTYAAAGTYSITSSIDTSVGNKHPASCAAPITVTPKQVVPDASCTLLSLLSNTVQEGTPATVSVAAATVNGATISAYNYNFGDGTPGVNRPSTANTDSTTHTYATPGTYQITSSVDTSVGNKTSAACAAPITVTAKPVPCPFNPAYPIGDARCKPCPENASLPLESPSCVPVIIQHKSVANTTQKLSDANNTKANSGDVLVYTLTTTNKSSVLTQKDFIITESIGDILDYADIIDLGGGTMDKDKIIHWPGIDIAAGKSVEKKFTVKVKDPIPATNTPISDAGTFDLKMINVYGDTITVLLTIPPVKLVETVGKSLPNTGPGTTLVIGFAITAVIAYFFARSRLLGEELLILRDESTAGS